MDFKSPIDKEKFLIQHAWLNLEDKDFDEVSNVLVGRTEYEIENPQEHLVRLLRKPENFYLTCKYLLNVELLPLQVVILQELWNHNFPMLVGARGSSKSYLLAVYSILKCILVPGSKIVVCGAAFRQSKVIFEYAENIWNNADILRDICSKNSRCSRDIDRCSCFFSDSVAVFIPIGTGEKIRGLRASVIIADEINSINKEIFEVVIQGFTSVSATPVQHVKEYSRMKKLKEQGKWSSEYEDAFQGRRTNQTILSGTAGYDFQNLSAYWKQYKKIIQSRGDRKKLEEIFGDEISKNFNYKDFCVMRIPYELLPEGFMDEKSIMRAKATIHSGVFITEYSACLCSDTKVMTIGGIKNIVDIEIGDRVLTHKGRFRKVLKKTCRYYDKPILKLKTFGFNEDIGITKDHPIWNLNDKWKYPENEKTFYLANLKELSNVVKSLKISDYYDGHHKIIENKIRGLSGSKSTLNSDDIQDIKNSSNSCLKLGKQYNLSGASICRIKNNQTHPIKNKFFVNNKIELDYNFGLIIGYYLSEGSATNQAVNFALDGHVEESLLHFRTQLLHAIKTVFDIEAKEYFQNNVARIYIHSAVIASFIKKLIPGVSHTKIIPDFMMDSNPDFLRGLITGYWNGDGHWKKERNQASAGCVNYNLMCQIKLILSYFDIASSLRRDIKRNGLAGLGIEYEIFSVIIYTAELNKFKKLFYNYDDGFKIQNDPGIKSCGDYQFFNLRKSREEQYNDYVYNLEVEEDNSYSLPTMTVHNCFAKDSDGFFRRTLIESCVGNEQKPVKTPSGEYIWFDPSIRGNSNLQYVIGVDPASEGNNFAITISELHNDHRRLIYCWTTNKENFKQRQKEGLTKEHDYYKYCCRRIRDLMKVFNIVEIGIDSQGGGFAIEEGLHDPTNMLEGEKPIWQVIDPDKEKDSDLQSGLHILRMINFADSKWTSEANHGLRKDMEDKSIIFPRFDSLTISLATEEDNRMVAAGNLARKYDSLEDCVLEIEDLKDELSTIVMTQTKMTQREHWDVPEVVIGTGKKRSIRKDRYSSLLICNMIARSIQRTIEQVNFDHSMGGLAGKIQKKVKSSDKLYIGPDWMMEGAHLGRAIIRR